MTIPKTDTPSAGRFPHLPSFGPGPPYPTPPAWYDLIQAAKRVRRELGCEQAAKLLCWLAECLEEEAP